MKYVYLRDGSIARGGVLWLLTAQRAVLIGQKPGVIIILPKLHDWLIPKCCQWRATHVINHESWWHHHTKWSSSTGHCMDDQCDLRAKEVLPMTNIFMPTWHLSAYFYLRNCHHGCFKNRPAHLPLVRHPRLIAWVCSTVSCFDWDTRISGISLRHKRVETWLFMFIKVPIATHRHWSLSLCF